MSLILGRSALWLMMTLAVNCYQLTSIELFSNAHGIYWLLLSFIY